MVYAAPNFFRAVERAEHLEALTSVGAVINWVH
jgi:hypothetical protein